MTSDLPTSADDPDPAPTAVAAAEDEEEKEEEEEIVVLNADRPMVIQWDDLQQELARLCSLASAHKKASDRKDTLALRLGSLIQVKEASLRQSNELEEMRRKLEERRLALGDLRLRNRKASEDGRKRREQLVYELRLLLLASKKVTAANQKLQEATTSLAGERGYDGLNNLRRVLRIRQQHMVAQVSSLYPVKALVPNFSGQGGCKTRDSSEMTSNDVSKPQLSSLTILGSQPVAFPLKKSGLFSDKKEAQSSAAALGYVAHAVSLIANILNVPLRYPIRFGGSRSYVHDFAPSIESTTSDLMPNATNNAVPRPTEFPLFLEGQDTTRAAYAVFLLNKDLEQLLNYIGEQSLGPRHVLANYQELVRIILLEQYLDS